MNTNGHNTTFSETQPHIAIDAFDTPRQRERLYHALTAAQYTARNAGVPVVVYYKRLMVVVYPDGMATGCGAG